MADIKHRAGIERERLQRAAALHWVHWLVVVSSLVVTLFAWRFSASQVESRVSAQFERAADQVIELISERMQKYEDALWAGTGTIHATGGSISHSHWLRFAEALEIEEKYPGINGIGVIFHVDRASEQEFLESQRRERPDFRIHPEHKEPELLPIAYIEPVEINRAAVGLDMAHETNRYTAARRSRETGTAQITGPIVLVQDAEKTPGFLFFVPFYSRSGPLSPDERIESFRGIVYAPFIVRKLLDGTLARDRRHVGISIRDGGETIFDEHSAEYADFDPNPLYSKHVELELYGRNWSFEIQSDRSFRAAAHRNQPTLILIGGILIDSLLLALFMFMSSSSRRALRYADLAKAELEQKASELEISNADLEQFAYVAAHDLQEPLRMVITYSQLLGSRYPQDDPQVNSYLSYVVQNAKRMAQLVQALLAYSRLEGETQSSKPEADSGHVARSVITSLELAIQDAEAEIILDELPRVAVDADHLGQIFQNLIGNALKFRGDDAPRIHIFAEPDTNGMWRFGVSDNGIGIDSRYWDRIFTVFKRLHRRESYEGTGIGLAICKRVVQRNLGKIWVDSDPGKGSTFYFTLPGTGDDSP